MKDTNCKKVLDFILKKGHAFEAEIAEELGIHFFEVRRCTDKLIKQGKIDVIPE